MIGHGYTKVECWTIANRLRLEAWEMERQIRARDRGWYHMLNWLVVLEAQARDWRKAALAAVHPACEGYPDCDYCACDCPDHAPEVAP